jgi:hypothetical protein
MDEGVYLCACAMEEPPNKFCANHQTRIQTHPSLIVVGKLFKANQTSMSSEF